MRKFRKLRKLSRPRQQVGWTDDPEVITEVALRIVKTLAEGPTRQGHIYSRVGAKKDLVVPLLHTLHALGMVRCEKESGPKGKIRTIWTLVQ
jgi:hypothetical protein